MKLIGHSDHKAIRRGQKMGEDFAKRRTRDFLAAFLLDSGIGADLYQGYVAQVAEGNRPIEREEFLGHLIKDYELNFGQAIALSYAMGFIDHAQGTKLETYSVQGSEPETPETQAQLELPGVLDSGAE